MYAKVIIDKPALGRTQLYTYRVPHELTERIKPGLLARVPFGPRLEIGFVAEIENELDDGFDISRLKDIDELLADEALLKDRDFSLAKWISEEYVTSLSETLKLMLPPGGRSALKRQLALTAASTWPPECSHIRQAFERCGGMVEESELDRIFSEKEKKSIRDLINAGIIGESFRLQTPKVSEKNRLAAIAVRDAGPPERSESQKRAWRLLLENKSPMLLTELMERAGISRAVLSAMAKTGKIEIRPMKIERVPGQIYSLVPSSTDLFELSDDQNQAVAKIAKAVRGGEFCELLLQGVTGSGKTEVYLAAAETVLATGGTVIVLVPEIALTAQIVARFKQRFPGQIAILHSNMSSGERFDQWHGVREGRYPIVIGPRSAVFAPLDQLRMIIIDEEHESAYKQGTDPRYDAREAARQRCKLFQAVLVLGSATPSLETRNRADVKDTERLSLPYRPMRRLEEQMPETLVVDLRAGNASPTGKSIGTVLSGQIEECLNRSRKSLLFLNRRGFARFMICSNCGHVEMCDSCRVSMTYHRPATQPHILRCHHCGSERMPPDLCPNCGEAHLGRGGIAIQQVEAELKFRFPGCEVIRMDADSVGRRGAHAQLLKEFQSRKGAILLGTQMIAKGIDFPEIDLVGVIDADVSLHMPDFRAAERTFQMLLQVCGRAGRGENRGRAVIQTYNPDHPAIKFAVMGEYDGFYEYELEQRRELFYPPFSRLVNIGFSGLSETDTGVAAAAVTGLMKEFLDDRSNIIVGPAPAPITKVRDRYRFHTIVKILDDRQECLARLREIHDKMKRRAQAKRAILTIDVDPAWLL